MDRRWILWGIAAVVAYLVITGKASGILHGLHGSSLTNILHSGNSGGSGGGGHHGRG